VARRRSDSAAGCFFGRYMSRKTSDIAAMPSKPRYLTSCHSIKSASVIAAEYLQSGNDCDDWGRAPELASRWDGPRPPVDHGYQESSTLGSLLDWHRVRCHQLLIVIWLRCSNSPDQIFKAFFHLCRSRTVRIDGNSLIHEEECGFKLAS
jgi:hypothetical protein